MKALKAKRKKGKYKPQATPATTIFHKGSFSSKDDLTLLSVTSAEVSSPQEENPSTALNKSQDSLGDFRDVSGRELGFLWVVGVWSHLGECTCYDVYYYVVLDCGKVFSQCNKRDGKKGEEKV